MSYTIAGTSAIQRRQERHVSTPIEFVGPETRCAGCPSWVKPITHGFRFDGSDAVFCPTCATEIDRFRRTVRGEADHVDRECKRCGGIFDVLPYSTLVTCPKCRDHDHHEKEKILLLAL